MKALITGGTGFVGSHIVTQLVQEKHAVRILSRNGPKSASLNYENVDIVRGDFNDVSSLVPAMEGIDVFYHIGEIKNRTKAASERNIRLMDHIIRNLRKTGCKRLVFISSITVCGIPSEVPANENTLPKAGLQDHYTEYKRECEKMLTGSRESIEYVIVRPAPVYGPGSRYLGRLLKAIKYVGPVGLPFIGNARNRAPLIYVKDLARAIYLSGLRPEASGQIFNLTDGYDHSWLDFFGAIGESMGSTVKIRAVPPLILKISALPIDFFSGFLGIELDPVHYVSYFASDLFFENTKAKKLLGWKNEYSLSEGVREMIEYYEGS
jgi:nucleoside-diphosphate-sugar epimerase